MVKVPPPPTDSQLQHYDYDIIMPSGGNRSSMLDFAQGVVAPRDTMGTLNVRGVVDPRDGHCLLKCPRGSRSP